MTRKSAELRLAEIAAEVRLKRANKTLTSSFMDRVEAEAADLDRTLKAYDQAAKYSGTADMYSSNNTRRKGTRWAPPSPLSITENQFKSLYAATRSQLPGYAVSVDSKGLSGPEIGFKAALGEGAVGSLLPSALSPNAFPMPLEPDRLFAHFLGATADTQSVSYLAHTGNGAPAAAVAELALKPDIGMAVTSKTVSFTTIAALQSFSRQLADDFPSWLDFVPAELSRAVIDAETDQIVNGDGTGANMLGLLATPGILTRAKGSDTHIDALVKSFNDLRVGSTFATADLVVMHPTTWTTIKTGKDSQGRYLLALNQANDVGSVNNVFGIPVVTNTKVPTGKAIVMDTSVAVLAWTRLGLEVALNQYGDSLWNFNALNYRAELRCAIGVQRPTAICVVSGLT